MNIKDVQLRLLAMGYVLPKYGADGFMGAETNAALSQYQRAHGLPVTGHPDERTLADMFKSDGAIPPDSKATHVIAKQPKATRLINEIIVHCTATPEGRDVSVSTIRSWHVAKGWSDIGYHYVVQRDGAIEAGRPEAKIGAHVEGHNTGTLGIVYVGGVATDGKTPKDTRTDAQKWALKDLCLSLASKYPAIKKVTGHNQYAAKACPSFDVQKDELGSII
jgi:N-acetylmuramoyl-L-alanine amidase